jgi:hypothetical protein
MDNSFGEPTENFQFGCFCLRCTCLAYLDVEFAKAIPFELASRSSTSVQLVRKHILPMIRRLGPWFSPSIGLTFCLTFCLGVWAHYEDGGADL